MVRWARFRSQDGRVGFGRFEGGVADGVIHEFEGDMFDAPRPSGTTLAAGRFSLLAPCVPTKMVALWNNYRALAAKLGKQEPAHPLFLIKPATCIVGPHAVIRRPTGYSGKIAFEGELGIVIGRRATDVPRVTAAAHIFGYTCVNDVTAADVLDETPDFAQWCRSKGYDTFGCIGPVIASEIDFAAARVVTRLGDDLRQNYPVADMIKSAEELVSSISHDMTLMPGDVIACGTSLGVGSMRDGSRVAIEIDGIGRLENTVSQAAPTPVAGGG